MKLKLGALLVFSQAAQAVGASVRGTSEWNTGQVYLDNWKAGIAETKLVFSQEAQAVGTPVFGTPEWGTMSIGVQTVMDKYFSMPKQFIPAPPPVSYPGPVNKNEPTPAKQSYYTRPLRDLDLR